MRHLAALYLRRQFEYRPYKAYYIVFIVMLLMCVECVNYQQFNSRVSSSAIAHASANVKRVVPEHADIVVAVVYDIGGQGWRQLYQHFLSRRISALECLGVPSCSDLCTQ